MEGKMKGNMEGKMEVRSQKEYDGKSIIIEQNHQIKEREKKKNRVKKRIAWGLVFFLAAGGGWYLGWGRNISAKVQSSTAVNITAHKGQEIIYARLEKVNGNEITYTITEEADTKEGAAPLSMNMDTDGRQFRMDNGNGGGKPQENVSNQSAGQSVVNMALIPVGTPVTTKLGTETTFSRLAAGDSVALVLEKSNGEAEIHAVYILG